MELRENLAEVVGAFIGDGCISRYREGHRTRTIVLFTGNSKNDREYYLKVIMPAVEKEFGGHRKLYLRKDENSLRYVLCDRKIVGFFIGLGMPIGVKGNRIRIPRQIIAEDKLGRACIRGIFNTDGSIYRRYSKEYAGHPRPYRNYAIIQFKMESRNVIRFLKNRLQRLGIRVNRITRSGNCSVIRVTDQKSVLKFAGEIGFTHPYHRKRYIEITGVENKIRL